MGLLRKWDSLGLLCLVPAPLEHTALSRVFGSYKDADRDRQIGDRKHMNNREARITAALPVASPMAASWYG